nr:NAD-dependent succinate-semialdehyde dehydrogenase [uncultured Cupriavidus sp.]
MIYPNTQLFIDGQWMEAGSGRSLPVLDPATNHEIGRVAHAGTDDLENAIAASQRGFEIWRRTTPAVRSKILRDAAQNLRERADSIGHLLTQEQGKPLREAVAETNAAADIVEWFADEGMRTYGRIVPSRTDQRICQMVLKDPVGPVAAFTPWNFPILQVVRKVSAALAAGCSIIVKGPEETPASPAALVRAFADAGLPSGVLSLVYGDPAKISSHLIAHPIIRKITFTGSTPVGKQLAALAGQHMKRTTMELGGHAPVIVCDDADVEVAVRTIGAAKFRNAGQVCISPTRFLVHADIHHAFSSALATYAKGLSVGNGLLPETKMGPLANERRITAMKALTRDAMERGAHLLAGGEQLGEDGNFWLPTVLDNVPKDAKAFNEEPFGPLAAIRSFERLDDAIAEANRLPYGLAAYAFTGSLRNADVLARYVDAGMLWVNMAAATSAELPFGGVKDSGFGSEGGPEALDAYLTARAVSVFNGV